MRIKMNMCVKAYALNEVNLVVPIHGASVGDSIVLEFLFHFTVFSLLLGLYPGWGCPEGAC